MIENRPGEGRIVTDLDLRRHLYVTAAAIAAVLVGAGFLAAE